MGLIEHIESKQSEHLEELKGLLRIPSVSAKSEHRPDIERAARWVAEKLRAAGLDRVEMVPTKVHPLVYGESLQAPGKPTVKPPPPCPIPAPIPAPSPAQGRHCPSSIPVNRNNFNHFR